MKLNIVGLIFGMLFGGVLAASNLHEYDTIHSMLRLDEIDVYLFMASAIAVSAPLLWLLERRGVNTPFGGEMSLSRSMPERHHIKGGALRINDEVVKDEKASLNASALNADGVIKLSMGKKKHVLLEPQ